MTDYTKHWVLAFKPFDPSGIFVHQIGDTTKQNPIVARHGVSNALRMSHGEALFLLEAIKEHKHLTFYHRLQLVNLADHLFEGEDHE